MLRNRVNRRRRAKLTPRQQALQNDSRQAALYATVLADGLARQLERGFYEQDGFDRVLRMIVHTLGGAVKIQFEAERLFNESLTRKSPKKT